jgi:hypothetical protein
MASYFLNDMEMARRLGGREAAGLISKWARKNENMRRGSWNAHPLIKGRYLSPGISLDGSQMAGGGINMSVLESMMQARHQGMVDRQSPGPMSKRPAGTDYYTTHSAPGMPEDHMSQMRRDAERTIVHNLPGPVTGVQHVNPAVMGMGPPKTQARFWGARDNFMRQAAKKMHDRERGLRGDFRDYLAMLKAEAERENQGGAEQDGNPWVGGGPVGPNNRQ